MVLQGFSVRKEKLEPETCPPPTPKLTRYVSWALPKKAGLTFHAKAFKGFLNSPEYPTGISLEDISIRVLGTGPSILTQHIRHSENRHVHSHDNEPNDAAQDTNHYGFHQTG